MDLWFQQKLGPHGYKGFQKFVTELDQAPSGPPNQALEDILVADLGLTKQIVNKLHEHGIRTVGDILNRGYKFLQTGISHFGKASAAEVKRKVEALGLTIPHFGR